MAISINWFTGVITVPQADLTPLGGSLYELNLNDFRLTLKDLEDDEAGMPWPKTHDHDTESTLAGTTFARKINILAPYTVVFEDGQYGVNLVGANSNVTDVLIRNQVSVVPSNSAGLIVTSGGGGSADWTTTEKNQIRGALGITGAQAAPTGGGHLQDVRTPVQVNLDVPVSSRAEPGDQMDLTQQTLEDIAWMVLEESLSDHSGSIGSLGHEMGHVHDSLILKHGTVQAGSTASNILTDLSGPANIFTGLTVMLRGATNRCARMIKTFDGTLGTITVVVPFAFTPQAGDSVFILTHRHTSIFGSVR